MKKYAAILIALVLLCCLAACESGTVPTSPGQDSSSSQPPDAVQPDNTPEAPESNPGTQAAKSPARLLLADFKSAMRDGEDRSAEDLANRFLANESIPFSGGVIPVEEGNLNGFSGEITGFAEGACFAPVIGSIPFVGYVFKLGSDTKPDDFVNTLQQNADLRWNICTQADEMVCEAVGSTVFFVMSPSSFDE